MKNFFKNLPSIIFNVVEVLIVIKIGELFALNFQKMILLIIIFSTVRMTMGGALHYKDWRKCLLMTTLFFASLWIVAYCDFHIAIVYTVFEAIILTGKGNIEDMFQWGGNSLNIEVFNWVKFNQNNKQLIEYENKLKQTDKQKYYIFVYRFREFKSYSRIAKIMDMDIQRISDEIKIMSHFIEYSIRLD